MRDRDNTKDITKPDETDSFEPKYRCKTCHGTGTLPGIKKVTGMGKGMGSEFGYCPDCDGMGMFDPR